MAAPSKKRVIVVGGGLAGLACTIKLAEEGVPVDLFSMVPVKRSHSVCAQGGINACNEIARQQGYSEWMHFDETALGGDRALFQQAIKQSLDRRILPALRRCGRGDNVFGALRALATPQCLHHDAFRFTDAHAITPVNDLLNLHA